MELDDSEEDLKKNLTYESPEQAKNIREIIETHYYNSVFSYVDDLSIMELFQRKTVSDGTTSTMVKFVFAHYEKNTLKLYDDMLEFLNSELVSARNYINTIN